VTPPVVTFIGWHSCGKTTLAAHVVHQLHERGWRVAVVKSTKDSGLFPDQHGTDTAMHRQAGARAVALLTPERMIITVEHQEKDLLAIARCFFPEMDIVIGEGFKEATDVPKIEVHRGGPLLREQVRGVIAVATDRELAGGTIFALHEHLRLAEFIEERFLRR
jgi:molybdopterin-guanine dinucleotide biosynthesis adapter protein